MLGQGGFLLEVVSRYCKILEKHGWIWTAQKMSAFKRFESESAEETH